MDKDSRLFDDLARMANGAMSSFAALRDEAEARLREQAEHVAASMDLVRRDEFEAVQALAANAREQAEVLAERLAALEQRLAALEAGARKRATGKGAAKASGEGAATKE